MANFELLYYCNFLLSTNPEIVMNDNSKIKVILAKEKLWDAFKIFNTRNLCLKPVSITIV